MILFTHICSIAITVGFFGACVAAVCGLSILLLMTLRIMPFDSPPRWLWILVLPSALLVAIGGFPLLIIEVFK